MTTAALEHSGPHIDERTQENVRALIHAQLGELDRLAIDGEWQKTEALLKRLPALALRVPIADRRAVLQETRTRVEQLRERVLGHSRRIAAQLTDLKTGRRAAAQYCAIGETGKSGEIR